MDAQLEAEMRRIDQSMDGLHERLVPPHRLCGDDCAYPLAHLTIGISYALARTLATFVPPAFTDGMNNDQLRARAEAMLTGIKHAIAQGGDAAGVDALITHLQYFNGAAVKSVQDTNAKILDEIRDDMLDVPDAPDETVAKLAVYDKLRKLLGDP